MKEQLREEMIAPLKPRPKRKIEFTTRAAWFLNGDLVSIFQHNKANGTVTLENFCKNRLETMTMKDFRRKRRRAYTIVEAAELLNRNQKYLSRRAREGWFPLPVGRGPNGTQLGTGPAYYSEEHLFEIRELMSQVHWGRKRKDGLITNNHTPTESELRARLNNQILVYIKNEDGEYVPTLDVFDRR